MNAARALGLLRGLRVPAVTTSEVAALLGLSGEAASQTLGRLRVAGLVWRIRQGLWALTEPTEPLAFAEYVTAPFPSYVSLQTALYLRGMTSQIPSVTYLVSLARSQRVKTSVGTFSVHRVAPEVFGGFEVLPGAGVKLATPEKALFDLFYLSGTRGRLFASLPEIELPREFRRGRADEWVARIPSARLRTLVTRRFDGLSGVRARGRGEAEREESDPTLGDPSRARQQAGSRLGRGSGRQRGRASGRRATPAPKPARRRDRPGG